MLSKLSSKRGLLLVIIASFAIVYILFVTVFLFVSPKSNKLPQVVNSKEKELSSKVTKILDNLRNKANINNIELVVNIVQDNSNIPAETSKIEQKDKF